MFSFIELSSLVKIFPDSLVTDNGYSSATIMKNETFSYQIAYTSEPEEEWRHSLGFSVAVESPIADRVTLREIVCVPSEFPVRDVPGDDDYVRRTPGLYPDLLLPLDCMRIEAVRGIYHSILVTVKPNGVSGVYPIKIVFTSDNGDVIEKLFTLEIVDAFLPEQELIFTNWFHCDCIASVYGVKVFSMKHWSLIEKFMRTAAENGMNMILTPLFTPPLDTAIGSERPTVQLVGVTKRGEEYSFDFSLLDKWIALAESCGIKYFEMSHLFTQWGAKAAPKIVATVGGRKKRIFGWDTPSDGDEYAAFLDAFLPELVSHLRKLKIAEKCVFHVSDEPNAEQLDSYLKAKSLVKKHLGGFKIMDALSDVRFYKSGAIEHPIPASDAIEPFISENIPDLWTYYCCGQIKGCSNAFFGMPSARVRVIGAQMYKYGIKGFLQWGYNFYYSALSREVINPFVTTDAKGVFPSGDAFRVYPGKDGPLESVRLVVFAEALEDMRAFRLLEKYVGRDEVVKLIEEKLGHVAFSMAPVTDEAIIALKEEVNARIKQYL